MASHTRRPRLAALLALTMAASLQAGCVGGSDPGLVMSAPPVRGADDPHVLLVDSLGRLYTNAEPVVGSCGDATGGTRYSEGVHEMKCEQLVPAVVQFKRFAHAFQRSRMTDLLFYFNGGLNKPTDIISREERDRGQIEKDGLFPVFMAWPTDGVRSYVEQTYRVHNGYYDLDAHPVRGTLSIFADMLEGMARAPTQWSDNLGRFRDSIIQPDCHFFVNDRTLPRANTVADNASACSPMQAHRALPGGVSSAESNMIYSDSVNVPPDRAADGLSFFATTIPRTLLVPFADGLGREAWQNMQRRTRVTIHAEYEIEGEGPAWDKLRAAFPHGTGGFAEFFALLEACTAGDLAGVSEEDPPDSELVASPGKCPVGREARVALRDAEITLIGHSMGSIVINELVRAFPDLNYISIVFLSGAASIRATVASLDPLLADRGRKPETYFYNLMLHPMNEAREMHFGGSIPAGSLLVWIDDMLEFSGDIARQDGGSMVQHGRRPQGVLTGGAKPDPAQGVRLGAAQRPVASRSAIGRRRGAGRMSGGEGGLRRRPGSWRLQWRRRSILAAQLLEHGLGCHLRHAHSVRGGARGAPASGVSVSLAAKSRACLATSVTGFPRRARPRGEPAVVTVARRPLD